MKEAFRFLRDRGRRLPGYRIGDESRKLCWSLPFWRNLPSGSWGQTGGIVEFGPLAQGATVCVLVVETTNSLIKTPRGYLGLGPYFENI